MEIKTDKNIINQIDRMIEHCKNVSQGYHVADFMEIGRKEIGYYKNQGWAEALMWCMGAIKHGSSVSDKPLTKQGDADNE